MKLLSMAATAVNRLSSHISSLFKFTTITTPGPNLDYLLIEIHPLLTIFLLLLLLHAPHWCLLLLILKYFALQLYLMQVCFTSKVQGQGAPISASVCQSTHYLHALPRNPVHSKYMLLRLHGANLPPPWMTTRARSLRYGSSIPTFTQPCSCSASTVTHSTSQKAKSLSRRESEWTRP